MSTLEGFQSRAGRTGREFEIWSINNISKYGSVLGTGVWMGGRLVEVDIEFEQAYVFAKGGEADRPGLFRTDNTKKCIADVVMLRSLIDKGVIPWKRVVVTTTAMPNKEDGGRGSQAHFLLGLVDEIIVRGD